MTSTETAINDLNETDFLRTVLAKMDAWFDDDSNLDDLDHSRDLIRQRLERAAAFEVPDSDLADVLDTYIVDPDDFEVIDRSDVQAVLHAALQALDGRPTGQRLNEIVLWPVGDLGELLLTVDTASGVRLASRTIPLASFTAANGISATDAVRHVLHELLRHHHTLTATLHTGSNASRP